MSGDGAHGTSAYSRAARRAARGANRVRCIYCIFLGVCLYARRMPQRVYRPAGSTGSRWACPGLCARALRRYRRAAWPAGVGRWVARQADHPRGRADAGDDHRRDRAGARRAGAWLHAARRRRSARAWRDGLCDDASTRAGMSRLFTIVGVMILALGHRLNIMATATSFLIACRARRAGLSIGDASWADTIISSTKAIRSRRRARPADRRGRAVDGHARRGVRCAGGLRQAGQRL